MQRENLAQRALDAAEKAVRDRKIEDEVAVLFFDRHTRTVADFSEWDKIDGGARAGDFKKRAADLKKRLGDFQSRRGSH